MTNQCWSYPIPSSKWSRRAISRRPVSALRPSREANNLPAPWGQVKRKNDVYPPTCFVLVSYGSGSSAHPFRALNSPEHYKVSFGRRSLAKKRAVTYHSGRDSIPAAALVPLCADRIIEIRTSGKWHFTRLAHCIIIPDLMRDFRLWSTSRRIASWETRD